MMEFGLKYYLGHLWEDTKHYIHCFFVLVGVAVYVAGIVVLCGIFLKEAGVLG